MVSALATLTAKPKKFILTVGDEGAILIYMEGPKVLRRMFAPTPAESKQFLALFKSDEAASISLLVDVMDQTYVPQTLPPVSPISINKLIQRRLDRDFPPDDLRGAIMIGRSEEGRKDWNYLFAAVSNVPPLSQWVKLIEELPNPLEGIYLLPVEAESILSRILPSSKPAKAPLITLSKPPKPAAPSNRSRWQLLVSHQKVGGFRQVVFRDGKLTFTRLAQPIGDPTPEVIAGNVEQELSNTIEYLKRLSFNPRDGLEVVVIVASEIRQHLRIADSNIREVHIRTPHEIAQTLGLAKATEETDHFGDVVLAAAFGSQPKHRLKLFTPYTKKLAALYDARRYGQIAGVLLGLLILLKTGMSAYGIYQIGNDIDFAVANKKAAEANLRAVEADTAQLPADLARIADIVILYEKLSAYHRNPLLMFSKLGRQLDDQTLVTKLDWVNLPPFSPDAKSRNDGIAGRITADFTVQMSGNKGTLKQFHQRGYRFFEQVQGSMPQYTLTHDELSGLVGANEVWKQDFNNASGGLLTDSDQEVTFRLNRDFKDEAATGGQP